MGPMSQENVPSESHRCRGGAVGGWELCLRAARPSERLDPPDRRKSGRLEHLRRRLDCVIDVREQERHAEAEALAGQLRAQQDSDPYHWIARGSQLLEDGQPREAVRALRQAEALSSGFAELHRRLAVAYLQLGDREQARRQLDLLGRTAGGEAFVSKLRHRIEAATP